MIGNLFLTTPGWRSRAINRNFSRIYRCTPTRTVATHDVVASRSGVCRAPAETPTPPSTTMTTTTNKRQRTTNDNDNDDEETKPHFFRPIHHHLTANIHGILKQDTMSAFTIISTHIYIQEYIEHRNVWNTSCRYDTAVLGRTKGIYIREYNEESFSRRQSRGGARACFWERKAVLNQSDSFAYNTQY